MTSKSEYLPHKLNKAEEKSIKEFFNAQFVFIKNLLKDIPRSTADDESEDVKNVAVPKKPLPKRLYPAATNKGKPARTVEELQARLAVLKGKPKLAYKEKLIKKGLKDRLKKRERKERRKSEKALAKVAKKNEPHEKKNIPRKPAKPLYKEDGTIIYSKFDFTDIGGNQSETKHQVKDPVLALKKLKEQNEKMKALKELGDEGKVDEVIKKKAWKTALMKSEGVKVRDDPELLRKTIKKDKHKKERSIEKWKARQQKVKKEQEEKQKKRMENIQVRARQKKLGKMKKAAKRGKVIAGF